MAVTDGVSFTEICVLRAIEEGVRLSESALAILSVQKLERQYPISKGEVVLRPDTLWRMPKVQAYDGDSLSLFMMCVLHDREILVSQLLGQHPELDQFNRSAKGLAVAAMAVKGSKLELLLKQRAERFLGQLYQVLLPLKLSPIRTVIADYML